MNELRDLYQEVLLDHSKRPRNFGVLEDADHHAIGHNPLCGDKVVVYLRMEGDRIADIRFHGQGCAVSQASASMMTESVKGKTRAEAEALFERFHELLTGGHPTQSQDRVGTPITGSDASEASELGKLAVFAGVRKYPVRVKCATLAWHTLRAALEQKMETVSTE